MTGPAVHVRALLRARGLDVRLEVLGGQVVAVLGPNGAGKSTVLGLLSGLVVPDEGRVVVGDRVLVDTASGVFLPAHRRGLGSLTQDPLLFPHLDVAANVAFGPRSAGLGRRRAREIAASWLEALDIAELAHRRPHELSGGQAQRVALARGLAVDPPVLLLDEPLAALDVAVAAQLRPLLRRVAREQHRTTLLVTHDLLDVLALADTIVVMEGGRVVEVGAANTVLRSPRSAFAARLAGVNLVTGTWGPGPQLRADAGGVVIGVGHGGEEGERDDGGEAGGIAGTAGGGHAVAVFAPAAVAVYAQAPGGSPRNVWRAVVVEVAPTLGGAVQLRAQAEGIGVLAADVTAAAAAELRLEPGAEVHLSVKAQEVALHPGH